MKSKFTNLRMVATLCLAALTLSIAAPISHARGGKDDPAGHDAGDDRGGKGRGKDDKQKDDRGGKGKENRKADDHGKHGAGHK